MSERLCLECGKKFQGRSDKKFCSDSCRVSYHNRGGSESSSVNKKVVKSINQKLLTNYKILVRLNSSGTTKVTYTMMKEAGLDFDYYTHTFTNENGLLYKFCYDQGYANLKGSTYLLVKKQDGARAAKPTK